MSVRLYPEEIHDLIKTLQSLKQTIENINKPPEYTILDDVDLCNFLKVSKRTSAYWREKGEITYSKLGGKIYYKLSDILILMKKHAVTAVSSRI